MTRRRAPTDYGIDWWDEPDLDETPAYLDPLETPVRNEKYSPSVAPYPPPNPPKTALELMEDRLSRCFIHSGWQPFRARVALALQKALPPSMAVTRFCDCGSSYVILRSKLDPCVFKRVPNHCHSRWCLPCSQMRAASIRANLLDLLGDTPVRLLTLTLRSTDAPLSWTIDRLYKCFRKLRSLALWKDRVTAGVAFLEVKRAESSGGWHPHLHVLIRGKYIDQAALSTTWLSITGDSHIVDIRLIRHRTETIKYIGAYLTKSTGLNSGMSDDDLVEVVASLSGRRTVFGLGDWRKATVVRTPSDETWELFAAIWDVQRRADDGDPLCQAIMDAFDAIQDPEVTEFRIADTS